MSDDQKRVTDWDGADLRIIPPKNPAPPTTAKPNSIAYEPGRVIAYLDDQGKLAPPATAIFARVWTADGVKLMSREPFA